MVVHYFLRAALAATSRNMLRTDLRVLESNTSTAHGTSWIIVDGQAAVIFGDVGVFTKSVSVVDLGVACACKDVHLSPNVGNGLEKSQNIGKQ